MPNRARAKGFGPRKAGRSTGVAQFHGALASRGATDVIRSAASGAVGGSAPARRLRASHRSALHHRRRASPHPRMPHRRARCRHGPLRLRGAAVIGGGGCAPATTSPAASTGPPGTATAPDGSAPTSPKHPGRRPHRHLSRRPIPTAALTKRASKSHQSRRDSMIVAIFHMLSDNAEHRDLGADWFDRRRPDARARSLTAQLNALGYHVAVTPANPA